MKALQKRVLVLEGTPGVVDEGMLAGHAVFRADNSSAASARLSDGGADLLILSGNVAWHRTFAANLLPERRPAVLVIGGKATEVAAIADEWLSPKANPSEVALRLEIAHERARVRRQNTRRNFVDLLTGLPNRRAILRALIRESVRVRRQGGALSMALLDIDDFKRVNDTYGHTAGDKLLRRIGLALAGVTRSNELCGRLGGDEFAIVIGGQLADASRAAERAKRALKRIGVSASAGAAEWLLGEQLRVLYRRADESLKASKANKQFRRRRSRPEKLPPRRPHPSAWTQADLFAPAPLRAATS